MTVKVMLTKMELVYVELDILYTLQICSQPKRDEDDPRRLSIIEHLLTCRNEMATAIEKMRYLK